MRNQLLRDCLFAGIDTIANNRPQLEEFKQTLQDKSESLRFGVQGLAELIQLYSVATLHTEQETMTSEILLDVSALINDSMQIINAYQNAISRTEFYLYCNEQKGGANA